MINCPWCKFTPTCPVREGMKENCDFESLPYEKEAILKRVRSEVASIDELKAKIMEMPDSSKGWLMEVIDKIRGIEIMSQRLIADFGMTMEDIKKEAPAEKFTFVQKMRFMKAMNDARGRESREKKG